MKKKAFTLVEIMAVVALIAILFVIFIPRIGFAANKTKIAGVQTDFNSYRVAMQTTAMENSGFGGSEAAAKTGLNKVLDAELQLKPASAKKDPWGNPYEAAYTNAPDEMVTISSKGIDGKEPLSISCIYKNGEVQFETVGP
ncbi:MAG: prepilin-type N-terminal cleavage/methylation domain-containing protein, partial [Anaerovorax sp.]